jgi:hypothetical protein
MYLNAKELNRWNVQKMALFVVSNQKIIINPTGTINSITLTIYFLPASISPGRYEMSYKY